MIDSSALEVVFVTDDTGGIAGVLHPETIVQRANYHLNLGANTFSEFVLRLSRKPEEARRNFEHEWLTQERPSLRKCPGGGGHYTSNNPCLEHGT